MEFRYTCEFQKFVASVIRVRVPSNPLNKKRNDMTSTIDFTDENGEIIASVELEDYEYDALVQQAMQEFVSKLLKEACERAME